MVDAAVQLRPNGAEGTLQVTVSGKLLEQRHSGASFYSLVISPAVDQWSQPMPFEIRSNQPLGQRGQVVTVPCELTGYHRPAYDSKPDPQTGEVRRIKPIGMALDALDS
jgi:hypothetical protein